MYNITYEQFEFWCKHWNMTIDEGNEAMCFAANIISQNLANCVDYVNKISNDDNHSDAFKNLVEKFKNDAIYLSIFYGNLNNAIFEMLEKHDEEAN